MTLPGKAFAFSLVARAEEQLHTEADAEGRQAREERVPDSVARARETRRCGAEGADPGQDEQVLS